MRIFLTKHWRKFALAAVSLPIVGYLVICLFIGLGVNNALNDAQSRFPGDSMAALIVVAASEDVDLSNRNRAIWALGQLGKSEALPYLEAMYSDDPCDHETKICQHELEKALVGCSGGTNIGAVVWRHGDLAVAAGN